MDFLISLIPCVKILILFISMTMLSVFLDEVGMFKYLANAALKRAAASQITLFFYLYIMVSVLTVFTSNDVIILTFTPFICYFAKSAGINPLPFLFGEFVAANTWSQMFVIGNPTNIYLATAADIGFFEYFKVMWLPTVMSGIMACLVLFLLFHKDLNKKMTPTAINATIRDKGLLIIGIIHLSLCTVILVASSYLDFEMYAIALGFAISLFVCVSIYQIATKRKGKELLWTLRRAPWKLVPFVLSMFLLILLLERTPFITFMADFLNDRPLVYRFGIASFLSANVINNIPMSVLYSAITSKITDVKIYPAVYACVTGSNIGAFFTPLGALAGIMWSDILKQHDINFSAKTFIKYGAVIAVPTLLAALCGIQIMF